MRAKQKIVQGRGTSNINLGIFVCSFDVGRASKPVPSINYGTTIDSKIPATTYTRTKLKQNLATIR